MKSVHRLASVLFLAGLLGASPKAYLRGPVEAKVDQSIILKFQGTVSDIPVSIEQVTGPEQVPLAHLFDKEGHLVYAEGTATVPGLYRFCVIAEGKPEGSDKAVRSYAFWDVNVTEAKPHPKPDEPPVVEPDDGELGEPSDVIPLTIGKASPSMKLKAGQNFVRFKFTPKSSGWFAISTRGSGAWRMELSGPDSWDDVIAVDDNHSGIGGNAKIEYRVSAGRVYYVKVKPLAPYLGKAFTIMVARSVEPNPLPPTPTPQPTPIPTPPPTPEPPVPYGELKVLFLQESEGPMTEKQLEVWHSGEVEEALRRNTTPGSDGVPGYRKWDKDQDPGDDTPEWTEMLNVAKAELLKSGTPLPVVVTFRGGKGTLKPLPSSVQELLAIIQK